MKTRQHHSPAIAPVLLILAAASCGVQTEEQPLGADDSGDHATAGTADGAGATGSAESGGAHAEHEGEQIVDAPDADAWVHLSLAAGLVEVSSDEAWDLRVSRTVLGTNSGESGPGSAGALETELTDMEALASCPAEGYAADEMLPLPGPPGSGEIAGNPVLNGWYNYDPATHAVTTKGLVYCIRTSAGAFVGLRVRNYASGQMTLQWKHL